MVHSLQVELELRHKYLESFSIESIYFGGGTPSLLDGREVGQLISVVQKKFDLRPDAEITLEANPDDLGSSKLKELKREGINRLSIGIQSFDEKVLRFLNRAHSGVQARSAVEKARAVGFEQFSLDLIYGIPVSSQEVFRQDVDQLLDLHPDHISAYHLTVEDQTALGKWVAQGKIQMPDDEHGLGHYQTLISKLGAAGYEHYEISNFARDQKYAVHNSNYWRGKRYLGIGPSAHSYDGVRRSFNLANNHRYIAAIEKRELAYEEELLTRESKINEYLMTSLRTKWGCDLDYLLEEFDFDLEKEESTAFREATELGWIEKKESILYLTEKGKLFADELSSWFFQ